MNILPLSKWKILYSSVFMMRQKPYKHLLRSKTFFAAVPCLHLHNNLSFDRVYGSCNRLSDWNCQCGKLLIQRKRTPNYDAQNPDGGSNYDVITSVDHRCYRRFLRLNLNKLGYHLLKYLKILPIIPEIEFPNQSIGKGRAFVKL